MNLRPIYSSFKQDLRGALPANTNLAVFCILIALIWTSYTSLQYARAWGWPPSRGVASPIWMAQLLSVPLLSYFLYMAASIRTRLNTWLLVYAAYALLFLSVSVGISPGCWTEDTRYTLHMVQNGWWGAWYSVIHVALTTAMLQILPWEFKAPAVMLALLWAFVYTFAHHLLRGMRAPRWMHGCLILLLLLPAQWITGLIVLRDSYFSAFFLIFLMWVGHELLNKQPRFTWPKWALACVLTGLLMSYRADAIPAVCLGLVALGIFGSSAAQEGGSTRWRRAALLVVLSLTIVFIASYARLGFGSSWVKGDHWDARTENEYRLTLLENSLGYLAKTEPDAIEGPRKAAIEKVFLVEDLKKHYCPDNLCVFFGGHWNKASTRAERDAFASAAVSVLAANPLIYLQGRLATAAAVGNFNTQTQCAIPQAGTPGPGIAPNQMAAVGGKLLAAARATEGKAGAFGGKALWWNLTWPCLVLVALVLGARRSPVVALLAGMLLVRSAVVMLAAPAAFSVYYGSLYVGAFLLLIIGLAERRWRASAVQLPHPGASS